MKPSSADQGSKTQSQSPDDVEALLRLALDGDPMATEMTAKRLVRSALAAPTSAASTARRRNRRRTWRLATAVLGAAAVAAVLVFTPEVPVTPDNDPATSGAGTTTAATSAASQTAVPETPGSQPIALEITNIDGPVIVSAAAGSKIVFLPAASPSAVPHLGGAS